MRMLLTDAGITNPSIEAALVALLGKPIEESVALDVPTALHPGPNGAFQARKVVAGLEERSPYAQLPWKAIGLFELTALPTVGRERWEPVLRAADVLLVEGGDALYLAHWMRESGVAELLPDLAELTYVGLSAGSMVMAPNIGQDFVGWTPPTGGDETLGLVDFAIFPHLDNPQLPDNTMAGAERWAARMTVPAYVMDDETAIKVIVGDIEVVSEGNWKLFQT